MHREREYSTARRQGESFYVYVVELRSLSGNPEVYVGSSHLPPDERLEEHRSGRFGSKHVRRRGVRLLPAFYRKANPLSSREDAKKEEMRIRRKLEMLGYTVFGSCTPDGINCSKRL